MAAITSIQKALIKSYLSRNGSILKCMYCIKHEGSFNVSKKALEQFSVNWAGRSVDIKYIGNLASNLHSFFIFRIFGVNYFYDESREVCSVYVDLNNVLVRYIRAFFKYSCKHGVTNGNQVQTTRTKDPYLYHNYDFGEKGVKLFSGHKDFAMEGDLGPHYLEGSRLIIANFTFDGRGGLIVDVNGQLEEYINNALMTKVSLSDFPLINQINELSDINAYVNSVKDLITFDLKQQL